MTARDGGVPDTAGAPDGPNSGTPKAALGSHEPGAGIPRTSRRRFYFLLVVLALLLVTLVARRTLFPSGRLKEDLQHGRELANAGEYSEAARLLDGYLRYYPNDFETLLYRGTGGAASWGMWPVHAASGTLFPTIPVAWEARRGTSKRRS